MSRLKKIIIYHTEPNYSISDMVLAIILIQLHLSSWQFIISFMAVFLLGKGIYAFEVKNAISIQYTMRKGFTPDEKTIKSCDEGAKGFQELFVITAKHINPLSVPFAWLLSRFYKREVTGDSVRYVFYFLRAK